jgi:hypothetical protein
MEAERGAAGVRGVRIRRIPNRCRNQWGGSGYDLASGSTATAKIPTTMNVLIDVQAAGGLESGRLERGVSLVAVRAGAGRYRVSGGRETHWVDLGTPNQPRCDCGDHLWRDRVCKHIVAALLREGDADVVQALGGLVRELRGGCGRNAQ